MRGVVFIACLSLIPIAQGQAQLAIPDHFAEGTLLAPNSGNFAPSSGGLFASKADPDAGTAGLPLGLRLQVPFHSTPAGDFVAGAFDRLYFVSPPPGTGFRYRQAVFEGGGGRLTIGPGVDAHAQYSLFSGSGSFSPSLSAGNIAADVDVIWQGTAHGRGDSLFGVKVGGGAVSTIGTGFLPVVSFFGGLRF